MINQTLASPIAGAMGRLCLRVGGPEPAILSDDRPARRGLEIGAAERSRRLGGRTRRACAIASRSGCIPTENFWFWRVEVVNRARAAS